MKKTENPKKRILVTGGAGYIGSTLIRDALADGYRIRCLETLLFGGKSLLGFINHPHFEFINGDIRNEEVIKKSLKDVESIVHLAAIVGDVPCQAAPEAAVQINFKGTKLISSMAKELGIKRFVFASTCSNYGILDSEKPADENSKLIKEGKVAKGKRGKIISWKEKLKARPPSKRPCIHHMKGRIEFKVCPSEYRCANCDFDQYFQDQYSVHAVVNPVDVFEIEGFRVPQGYYFHPGHTRIKVEEGSTVRIGLDEFVLRLLGPLDSIQAPLMGKEVKQDRADMELFRGTNHAKVLSPVSGVVTATNPKLRDEGSLANRAPYSEGWIMSVHSESLREDLKNLMINWRFY